MLPPRHSRFRLADIEDHILRLDALDGSVEDFTHAMVVLVEDRIPLGLAHLLEDNLLGHLRGDATEHIGRFVVTNLAADLYLGRKLASLFKRDLVDWVFDLLGRFDDGLIDIRANFPRVLVQLGAHVLLCFVVLARGERDPILDGSHDDFRLNAFVAAQHFNSLIKWTCHGSSLKSQNVSALSPVKSQNSGIKLAFSTLRIAISTCS